MILRAEKITKKFFRKMKSANYFYALNETDFELRENSLTVIKGRSGSGKTTLLNILGGLLEPSGGKVWYGDKDIYSLEDKELSRLRNEKVGVIPQGSTGIYSLNVLENVLLPTVMYKSKTDESEKYALELLEKFGVSELAEAMPSELSGGEMRRMSIARSLVTKPAFVLADEPTGDLDDENTEAVLRLLKEIAESGTAVLMVTHEADALNYADLVYRMDGGVLSVVSDK